MGYVLVPAGEPSVLVEQHDIAGQTSNQGTREIVLMAQVIFDPLALGDVLDGANNPDAPALLVA